MALEGFELPPLSGVEIVFASESVFTTVITNTIAVGLAHDSTPKRTLMSSGNPMSASHSALSSAPPRSASAHSTTC